MKVKKNARVRLNLARERGSVKIRRGGKINIYSPEICPRVQVVRLVFVSCATSSRKRTERSVYIFDYP